MPILVGEKDHWQLIQPSTSDWKTMKISLTKEEFGVATDLFYVNVNKS